MTQSQFALESPRSTASELQRIAETGEGGTRTGALRGAVAETLQGAGAPRGSARGAVAEAVEAGNVNPFSRHNALVRSGQHFAQWADDVNRLATGIESLKRGASLEEAAEDIIKFHFDFSHHSFTPFENSVMRRMFPFYAWTRRNVPAQLWAAIHTPGRFVMPAKVQRAWNADEEINESVLPEYMVEGVPIRVVDDNEGRPQYVYGIGLPAEDLNMMVFRGSGPEVLRSIRKIASQLSPQIKGIAEPVMQQNLFFAKKLADMNRAPAAFRLLPKPVKSWINLREIKRPDGGITYTMNPLYLNMFENNPTGFQRLIKSVSKLFDPRRGMDARVINAISGSKLESVDLEQQRIQRLRELNEQRLNELAMQGEPVKTYTSYYTPEGSEPSQEINEILRKLRAIEKERKRIKEKQ